MTENSDSIASRCRTMLFGEQLEISSGQCVAETATAPHIVYRESTFSRDLLFHAFRTLRRVRLVRRCVRALGVRVRTTIRVSKRGDRRPRSVSSRPRAFRPEEHASERTRHPKRRDLARHATSVRVRATPAQIRDPWTPDLESENSRGTTPKSGNNKARKRCHKVAILAKGLKRR